MLFAVDGSGSIPIIAQVLKRDVKAMKRVIQIGTLIPVVVIAVFVLTVVGVSGPSTSQDALAGLGNFLGDGVIKLALSFGVLSIVTSFFVVAESVKETLWWDFKFNKFLAWAIAVFLPFGLFVAGMNDFISVVSFAGAIAGSISAIILILVFFRLERSRPRLMFFRFKPPAILLFAFIALFLAGMFLTIFSFV
jgi:tyrosine-specific transport protein